MGEKGNVAASTSTDIVGDAAGTAGDIAVSASTGALSAAAGTELSDRLKERRKKPDEEPGDKEPGKG